MPGDHPSEPAIAEVVGAAHRRLPRVGVRIILDDDFEPGADDDLNAQHATSPAERAEFERFARDARAWHASGEWSAYGLVAVHECPACGDPHQGGASVWGVEMDSTTAVDSVVWDLAALGPEGPENYLRSIVAEVMDEERATLQGRVGTTAG